MKSYGPNPKALTTSDYMRKRASGLPLTMIVMGASFILYYLGFFGNVEGPLSREALGAGLAGMGVTKTSFMIFFLLISIIMCVWDWIFNLAARGMGLRLTCTKKGADGKLCKAAVKKSETRHKRTGRMVLQYVCDHGHKRPGARFNPVKKGMTSYTLCIIFFGFTIAVLFLS